MVLLSAEVIQGLTNSGRYHGPGRHMHGFHYPRRFFMFDDDFGDFDDGGFFRGGFGRGFMPFGFYDD